MVTAFLDKDEYTVSEVEGTIEVCVILDGFIDREVTVNLSTVDGTAIGIICIHVCKTTSLLLNLFIKETLTYYTYVLHSMYQE